MSVVASSTVRAAFAPQWGQNCIPTNIVPKHAGQAMEVRIDPQYSHREAFGLVAAAPQVGQFSEAGIAETCAMIRARARSGRAFSSFEPELELQPRACCWALAQARPPVWPAS